jgi:chromatin remodeling complex protein RSC6|tara:strand:+ start:5874 stop:6329 length:456 start_codon:yes stop_codon:yes gene_type:complete
MSLSEIKYIEQKFNGIFSSLNTYKVQITSLQQQVKILEKHVVKELILANKIIEKNKNKAKRKPSGFALKTHISDDLCNFMGLSKGEMCARTDVTKFVIKYIKAHNLQNAQDKRIIEPNEELQSLLQVPDDVELTYFTIQKHMNAHFKKKLK